MCDSWLITLPYSSWMCHSWLIFILNRDTWRVAGCSRVVNQIWVPDWTSLSLSLSIYIYIYIYIYVKGYVLLLNVELPELVLLAIRVKKNLYSVMCPRNLFRLCYGVIALLSAYILISRRTICFSSLLMIQMDLIGNFSGYKKFSVDPMECAHTPIIHNRDGWWRVFRSLVF